jgi:hypothetical protein
VCARISPGREVRGLTRGLFRALTVLRWQRLQIRRMGVHTRCARGGVSEGQSLLTQHRNEHCSDTCLGWACEGTHGLRNMASGQYARFTQSGISVSASHVVTVVRGAVLSTTTRGCHQRLVAKEDSQCSVAMWKGQGSGSSPPETGVAPASSCFCECARCMHRQCQHFAGRWAQHVRVSGQRREGW